jgi:hypothetical protein
MVADQAKFVAFQTGSEAKFWGMTEFLVVGAGLSGSR